MSLIEVRDLVKVFDVVKKDEGLSGALRGLFRPKRTKVRAVDGIDFNIETGEIVGYIGPNGAGKSTTIKMMTGILHPTSGEVRINSLSPHKNRKAVVQDMGVIFGQHTQLYWDLRLGESFELLRRIYRVDHATYKSNIDVMSELLNLDELLDIPVRQLSLGQRMRGDFAAAMLHSPSILFLDEPTIGLDVVVKQAIREFILQINRERHTTILLTTHDVDDVQRLCQRLIIIDHGKVMEDGPLSALIDKLSPYRLLVVDFEEIPAKLDAYPGKVVKQENTKFWLQFHGREVTASRLIESISRQSAIRDLNVIEPNLEDVIKLVYSNSGVQ